MNNVEIIINFAIDSLLNYINDDNLPKTIQSLQISLPEALRDRSIDDIKNNEIDWKRFLQYAFYQHFLDLTNRIFFTPFFITNPDGHGDYWLIHLSKHATARDVMTQVHWEFENHSKHYGYAGLNMFNINGYNPKLDTSYKNQYSFNFNDEDKQKNNIIIAEQLPDIIYNAASNNNPLTFQELYSNTCNSTTATRNHYKESIQIILDHKEIEIQSKEGAVRKKANAIKNDDIILPAKQLILPF